MDADQLGMMEVYAKGIDVSSEAPPIDPAADQAMLEFIAARKAAMPDEIG